MKKLREHIDGKQDFDDYKESIENFMDKCLAAKLNTPFIPDEPMYVLGLCTLIKAYFDNNKEELKKLWDKQEITEICLN